MNAAPDHRRFPARRRAPRCVGRAFTIAEATISTVIVAVLLAAALTTVGASQTTQRKAALVVRGQLLAEALMAEILWQSYAEPDGAISLGVDTGEAATVRSNYDDVDDYQGWSDSPPTAKDGTTLTNTAGWKRTVTVEWINATNPSQTSTTETGAKRITVTSLCQNVPQATLVAVKTVDWK